MEAIDRDEVASWFAHGTFTSDWCSIHFPVWMELLHPWTGRTIDVLEIGSWEGRSALFFLNCVPRARLACIDPFTGNAIHRNDPALTEHLVRLESIFDANVAAFADRVEKLAMPSATALPRLGIDGRRFDLAYVDGSHVATDVFRDAALLWPMMRPGGIVIFDDYRLEIDPDLQARPKIGIDRFLQLFEGQYSVMHDALQMIVRKC